MEKMGSASAEPFFDFTDIDVDESRSAMGAESTLTAELELFNEGFHCSRRKFIMSFDGGFAGGLCGGFRRDG